MPRSNAEEDSPVKYRISITMLDGGIADVRLIRTDKMNALDPAMWEALAEAVDQLKAMAGLRVVVLSGEGRAFCAGLDLSSLGNCRDPGASSAGGGLADRPRGIANNAHYAAGGWRGRSEDQTSKLQPLMRNS